MPQQSSQTFLDVVTWIQRHLDESSFQCHIKQGGWQVGLLSTLTLPGFFASGDQLSISQPGTLG